MSYNLTIVKRGNYLHCTVSGTNNLHHVVHYLSEIHDAIRDLRCSNVLIEENLSGKSLNLLQMFSVIQFAKKTILSLPHKIAYVDVNPEHNIEHLQLTIKSALYHFITVEMFTSVSAAEAWIAQQ
jgi:hypothetical protein